MKVVGWIATIGAGLLALIVVVVVVVVVVGANEAPASKARDSESKSGYTPGYSYVVVNDTHGATASMTYWGTNYGVSLTGMKVTAPKTNGVKDIVIECVYAGGTSDTIIATHRATVYESVPAGKTRTFNAIRVGFAPRNAKRGGCSMVSASLL